MSPVLLLLISNIVFAQANFDHNKLNCARINHLLNIKQNIANDSWPDFAKTIISGPMLYYTNKGIYAVQPNKKLLKRIKFEPVNCLDTIDFGRISDEIDSSRFHMNVNYHGSDRTKLYYKNNLAFFSDIELTNKFIPDVNDTDEWLTMVIHEMFHLYQRSFKRFRKHQVKSQQKFKKNKLMQYYKELDWYQKSIVKENDLLLKIIIEADSSQIPKLIEKYFQLKKTRTSKIFKEYKVNIENLESTLERSEGIARYIEYKVKLFMTNAKGNSELKRIDAKYSAKRYFNYNLNSEDWMYKPRANYFYATGFNLTRVLEKLNIDYQESIFRKNKSFEHYLRKKQM